MATGWLKALEYRLKDSSPADALHVYHVCRSYLLDLDDSAVESAVEELAIHFGNELSEIPQLCPKGSAELHPQWATSGIGELEYSASQCCALLGLLKLQQFIEFNRSSPRLSSGQFNNAVRLYGGAVLLAAWSGLKQEIRKTRKKSKANATLKKSNAAKGAAGPKKYQGQKALVGRLYLKDPSLMQMSNRKAAEQLEKLYGNKNAANDIPNEDRLNIEQDTIQRHISYHRKAYKCDFIPL